MSEQRPPVVRRVEVADEPLLGGDRYDYADAFEARVADPDNRSAEDWVRSGLEQAPWVIRRGVVVVHRFVIGFRLAPRSSPDHVLGWRIVTSRPDLVQLEAVSPLVRGVIVARRPDETSAVLTTFLFRTQPVLARLVWAIVGPVHRRAAPYLLRRAARGAGAARTHR
jgi:hypothetical protein